MAKNSHYTPPVSRFLLCVLYHEAKRLRIPMTKLVENLLRKALVNTVAWKTAEESLPEIR